jgi:endoglucanase
LDPKSSYMKLLAPFLQKKKELALDAWGASDVHLAPLFSQIETFFRDNITEEDQKRYPWPVWKFEQFISRVVRNELLSEFLVPEWARYFQGLSGAELKQLGESFAFDQCLLRDELNVILKKDSVA